MSQPATQCPHCKTRMQLQRPDLAGKKAKCPSCQEVFVIKLLAGAETEKAVPASQARPKSSATKPQPQKAPAAKAAAKPAAPKSAKAAVAKDDMDFPLEEVEILEAEEIVDEPQSEDDWLNALDTLEPKGPSTGKATNAAAPVVRGRVKKPKESGKRRKRQWRDADGDLPLWLSRLLMIGTGFVAGAFGVIIWAALIARTGGASGYIAMFVGGLVGGGVRLGAAKYDFGWFPAITAAVIALIAIIGGKVYGVHTLRKEFAAEVFKGQQQYVAMLKHKNYPISLVAEEMMQEELEAAPPVDGDVAVEFEDAEFLEEMDDFDGEYAYDADKFPKLYGKHWAPAKARWESMPAEERAEIEKEIASQIEYYSEPQEVELAVNQHRISRRGRSFTFTEGSRTQVLSVFDFLFAGVALIVAFRIAAGIHGDGD